jgi:hypothetical protein
MEAVEQWLGLRSNLRQEFVKIADDDIGAVLL